MRKSKASGNLTLVSMQKHKRPKLLTKVKFLFFQQSLEPSTTYDYETTRDRWKFLSKELQLKQEFLQRTVKDIQEKSDELKTTGREILNLRKDLNTLK